MKSPEIKHDPPGIEAGTATSCSERIFLVSLESGVQRDLRQLLGTLGSVTTVADGAGALDATLSIVPDLLFIETRHAPEAVELLRALRTQPATCTTPVLILCSNADDCARVKAYEAGVDDFIFVPVSDRELLARVQGVTSRNRARRRAEDELRESERKYRSMVEQAAIGMGRVRFDDAQWIDVNYAFCSMLGYARKEMLRIPWPQITFPEDLELDWVPFQRMAAGELDHYSVEKRFIHKQGHLVWARLTLSLVRDACGNPQYEVAIIENITERKKAEEALRQAHQQLRESEERYHTLFNSIDEGYCIIEMRIEPGERTDYRFIEINQAFEHQSGRVNVLGKWMRELRPNHEELWFQLYGDVALSGQPVRTEAQSYALGKWFSVYAFRIGNPEQRRVAVLFSDITQRKKAEESLRRLNNTLEMRVTRRTAEVRRQADHLRALAAELSRAEQSERKRLAAILHDRIQQLLVAARLQLDRVNRDVASDQKSAAVQDANKMLYEAIEASRSLMLDLSPPVLHQAGLIAGLKWLTSRMQQQYQLTVELNLRSIAEPAAEEIRFLLFEWVRELLFNVVKHANVRRAKVSLAKLKNNLLRLIVSDEGSGFDPSLLEHRRPEELTFGLFGIQERLAHLGGRMKIESAPGKGTAITLKAPDGIGKRSRQQAVLERKRGKAGSPHTPQPRTHKCRVLIVDDHKIMREGIAGLLQSQPDIEIVGEAADGPQAIELAFAVDPDVIIMDVNLGAMSGIEATRRILANNPRPRIIGLSMHSDPSIAEAMHAAGAAHYLTKGGAAEDLIATILSAASR